MKKKKKKKALAIGLTTLWCNEFQSGELLIACY